jgi:hypothetical protein
MQADDYLYLGLAEKARGLAIDMDGTNAQGTAAMNVGLWTGGGWVTYNTAGLTLTDGTFTTCTFGQDGLVTWTVPTDMVTARLADTGALANPPDTERLYWLRLSVSTALTDTSVTIDSIVALMSDRINQADGSQTDLDEVYISSVAGGGHLYEFEIDSNVIGGVELTSASITSAANINYYE